jgi:ribonucleoside-diphosphate reductase alpha chain
LNIGTNEIKSTTDAIGGGTTTAKTIEKPLNLPMDEHRVTPRIRPEVVNGKTYKVKTGYGSLFVTVNDDERGAPLEVFATLGKSGGFFQEQSEALCRLISVSLRSHIKVEEIIQQLKGIRGPMPVMTNKGTVLSLPDAIAQILEEHATKATKPAAEASQVAELVAAATANTQKSAETPIKKQSLANYGMMPGCPECGGNLILKEGCMACSNCGFSRCG